MKLFAHVQLRRPRAFVLVALASTIGLVLGFPCLALASIPSVETLSAFSTSATTATVEGEVNPEGESTHYRVAYSEPNSGDCRIGGTRLEELTSRESLGASDATSHRVEISLSGLTQGAKYCAEVIAENSSGIGRGEQQDFTAGAPKTRTLAAHATGTETATVEGTVNPASQATEYRVAYEPMSSPLCSIGSEPHLNGPLAHNTSLEPLGIVDSTFHSVAVGLSGLSAGTEYCAQLIDENGSGTEEGAQVTFKTAYLQGLNIALAGTGSGMVTGADISCTGSCWHAYAEGTTVTLTATPAAGSTFTGWSGACTGSGTCNVTLDAVQSVTATFTASAAAVLTSATGSVSLDGSTITVQKHNGDAAIKLACTGSTSCAGKLTLTAKLTRTGENRHARTETIGTARFFIPAGKTVTINLKLNETGRTLLSAASGRLGATLTMLKTTPGPSNEQANSVHLVFQKARKNTE